MKLHTKQPIEEKILNIKSDWLVFYQKARKYRKTGFFKILAKKRIRNFISEEKFF